MKGKMTVWGDKTGETKEVEISVNRYIDAYGEANNILDLPIVHRWVELMGNKRHVHWTRPSANSSIVYIWDNLT